MTHQSQDRHRHPALSLLLADLGFRSLRLGQYAVIERSGHEAFTGGTDQHQRKPGLLPLPVERFCVDGVDKIAAPRADQDAVQAGVVIEVVNA